ncbi:MAG TPA: response regulator [Polyangiaceae bacterium]|jgi:CheY-like chemotaxis protein|nr:response regulator [Polyangiaceae bacterium]
MSRTRVSNGLEGLTVLVVDDDADCRDLLKEFLGGCGATCICTSSGRLAIDEFSRSPPDILVSDLWMTDGDGFDLIRRIRTMRPDQGGLIPAIAVSAGSNAEQALMAGYHVLLAKPYDPQRLVEIIDQFVRADNETPSLQAPWTLSTPSEGVVLMTFADVQAGDVRAAMAVLRSHLEKPCEIIADCQRVTSFALPAASVAERAVWARRHHIRHVRVISGSGLARLVAAAACTVLGLKYKVESGR